MGNLSLLLSKSSNPHRIPLSAFLSSFSKMLYSLDMIPESLSAEEGNGTIMDEVDTLASLADRLEKLENPNFKKGAIFIRDLNLGLNETSLFTDAEQERLVFEAKKSSK